MKCVCQREDCPGVALTDSACARCGLKMTVGGLSHHVSKSVLDGLRSLLGIACPNCRAVIPAFASTCMNCGTTLTVEVVAEETLGPHRERLKTLVAPTPAKKRFFQWAYVVASAILFWKVLELLETRFSDQWEKHVLLSVIYIAVFFLFALWLIPRTTIVAIRRRASHMVKLGIVLNAVTCLVLLQFYLATWWARSLMLAGIFVATWFGAFVFWRFLWPASLVMGEIFDARQEAPFDPRNPQGRNVEFD